MTVESASGRTWRECSYCGQPPPTAEHQALAEYVAHVEADLGRPISEDLMAETDAAWHGHDLRK